MMVRSLLRRLSFPPLWAMTLSALVVAAGAVAFTYWLLHSGHPKTSGGEDVAEVDLLKIALAVVAAAGVVLGGVYAFRKQHFSETQLHTDRYAAAAEQLGHADARTRLAGVYAMARLADDWAEQRQVCVDVLCAYMRLPPKDEDEDEEVRRTLIRVICEHLRPDRPGDWTTCDFSFEGAEIGPVDFRKAVFRGRVTFYRARFAPGEGRKVHFEKVRFEGPGAWFRKTEFVGEVSFKGAHFGGKKVTFAHAPPPAIQPNFRKLSYGPDVKVEWGPFPPQPGSPKRPSTAD